METKEKMIPIDDEEFFEFLRGVSEGKLAYKVGVDSCTVPALINYTDNIDMDSLDTCEGARWSAYISSDIST
ncbi:MAG: hypothetical protein ACI4TK_02690 [Agathobacter sp.]